MIKEFMRNYRSLFLGIGIILFLGSLFYGYVYEKPMTYYYVVIGVLGVVSSLFYGWKAVIIFGYPKKDQKLPEHANSWWIHQFWFNFVGSLVGWLLIILFIHTVAKINIEDITVTHLLVLLFGTLGIVGLLPSLLAQIPNILHLLTRRFAEDYYKDKK